VVIDRLIQIFYITKLRKAGGNQGGKGSEAGSAMSRRTERELFTKINDPLL
jgi:hypothetical protein